MGEDAADEGAAEDEEASLHYIREKKPSRPTDTDLPII